MDQSVASRQEWESPDFTPSLRGLNTTVLREAWAKQIRDIMQASNIETLSSKLHHSAGWLTGLMHAEVIDVQAFEKYQRERLEAEATARVRFATKGSSQ